MKNKVLASAFTWLFIGLVVCFGVSFLADMFQMKVYGAFGGYGYLVYTGLELLFAIIFIAGIRKLSPTAAKIIYLFYTALTGLTLGGLMLFYTGESIAYVFLATALIFGSFAVIGKVTKADLSKWIYYLIIALFAIIVLEIINIFLANNTLDMILCIAAILIFCAYTAYDIQKLMKDGYLANNENGGIYCAFNLFLDFINIFIRLLRLFGKSRD